MTAGLHRTARDGVVALFDAGWTHPTIPVYWRANDAEPLPDPHTAQVFLRNEVEFGRELVLAYGSGRLANERALFGSALVRVYAARWTLSEDTALDLMSDALACFRGRRTVDTLGNTLSFIGEGSGFDVDPTEDGNWFVRGAMMVFEYRFIG